MAGRWEGAGAFDRTELDLRPTGEFAFVVYRQGREDGAVRGTWNVEFGELVLTVREDTTGEGAAARVMRCELRSVEPDRFVLYAWETRKAVPYTRAR